MLHKKTIFILLFCWIALLGCKEDKQTLDLIPETDYALKELKYAKGFSIRDYGEYKILNIISPWPESEEIYSYVLSNNEDILNIKSSEVTPIKSPIEKIVVTSTTHIPALELLHVEETLVGFPGTNYVSSEKTRARIDNHSIRELGKNEGINTEVLLDIQPDLVVGFGIDGNNKTFETIKKSGIPVIYNGDWVESSPLAKAEWIKFFGVLFNKEKEADAIFNQIEADYLKTKAIAAKAKEQPTVLCGAMYKDVWYLPNGTSPEAQILKDANVNYLWSDTTEKGSIALSLETVFDKAKDASLWLSPSYYNSLNALEKASQHYAEFAAFKNKKVYSFVNTTGKTGGVIYYELGTARPDLVLKDIIKVCHPELLIDYEPHFFKPLE